MMNFCSRYFMVEAAGIEPASVRTGTNDFYRLTWVL